ncbi:MAG TPA: CHRD domain-containing protein [Longimicrobiales bacterium]|nr:CHRD domain-containing protein [Longimicrobiales bacterium]
MKPLATAGLTVALVLVAACSESEPTAVAPVPDGPAQAVAQNCGTAGTAQLSGANEVPSRDTPAGGQATVRLSDDGTSLSYQLIVANIDNVLASHLHPGPPDQNGPVVASLAGPFPAAGGPVNGVLAQGTITAANLLGPLAGQRLEALLSEIAGNIYVNVHTNDGVAPPNTGPGDFPGGEIRGQIR